MDLINIKWNEKNYKLFIKYLFSLQDLKYQEFNKRLIMIDNIIGIRNPILRNISKEISKGDYKSFLKICKSDYYEEDTLYGFVLSNLTEYCEVLEYIDIFKNKINNWSTCDLTCSGLKIVNKNKDEFLKYIKKNIKSKKPWIRRFCFVLLLNYYVENKYLNIIFKLCDKYSTKDYYVNMAIAWLLSYCYIYNNERTLLYLKDNNLDKFTYNKAIQKVIESTRIERDEKEQIKKLKH